MTHLNRLACHHLLLTGAKVSLKHTIVRAEISRMLLQQRRLLIWHHLLLPVIFTIRLWLGDHAHAAERGVGPGVHYYFAPFNFKLLNRI